MGVAGEYLDISESPLTRAAADTSDRIAIRVYSGEVKDTLGGTNFYGTNYAYGIFKSLENVSIKLLAGRKYKFDASILVNAYDCPNGHNGGMCPCTHSWVWNTSTDFTYSYDFYIDQFDYFHDNGYKYERFYGELALFDPLTAETVEIHTKRVSYGVKYIVEGMTEGYLEVKVGDMYTVNIYAENPENEDIYTFNNIYAAWKGNYVSTGTGEGYYLDSYKERHNLKLTWIKDSGNTPLGTYYVDFKRNVKTTIRIKVEDNSTPNGIVLTRQEAAWSEDDNEYLISGGEVVEVPVTQQ